MRRLISSIFLACLLPAALSAQSFLIVFDHNGVRTVLNNGGTVVLGADHVGAEDTGSLTFTNRGTNTAHITAVEVYGTSDVSLVDPPALPVSVAHDASVTLAVKYLAVKSAQATATLLLTSHETAMANDGSLVNGPDVLTAVNLVGTAPEFAASYALSDSQNLHPIAGGSVIQLGDAQTGSTKVAAVVVSNRGSRAGQLKGVSLEGPDLTITGLPLLPADIAAGSSAVFNIRYTPTGNGALTGTLKLDYGYTVVEAAVQGNAVGPVYKYELFDKDTTSAITPGTAFDLSAVRIGEVRDLTIVVTNTGNAEGTISGIAVAGTEFQVTDAPVLPAKVAPGGSISIVLRLLGTAVGPSVARVRINSTDLELRATIIRDLSFRYRIEGGADALNPNDTVSVNPMQQPAIGITLDEGYPFAIRGGLTLVQDADGADASVQFITGGATVTFEIPANTTQAIFPNNLTSIRLQTGSVAGSIVLSPVFLTDRNVNVTPDGPQRLTLAVAPAAPGLLNGMISSSSASSFTLLATGYTTTRDLTNLRIDITPAAGRRLSTGTFSVDVSGPSTVWFRSAASNGYGGLFSMTIPFSAQGSFGGSKPQLLQLIQSIQVQVSNGRGSSGPLSIAVH
jgi:hypothetical protein